MDPALSLQSHRRHRPPHHRPLRRDRRQDHHREPLGGDDSLDLENAIWYQQAIAAEGEIIYTDAYTDTITGMPVVTIAKETSVPGNVVAFDIFPENFRTTTDTATLPENSNYYLCDASGTLLYSSANSNIDSEELQPYLYQLVQSIQAGTLTEENSVFQNPSGERRVIYYNVASNGWYSLVTIPYSELIQGLRTATILYAGVLLIFLGITIFMNIRDHRLNQRMARSNETVRVLGNSYYAIYRMDFSACTYEMIKGSDYIREHVNKTGGYEDLLHAISQVIEPSAKQEFLNSFSLENIQRLAAQRVRDFGGDFQRLFNEEYRWVNVRLLIDESLSSTEAVLCFREVDGGKAAPAAADGAAALLPGVRPAERGRPEHVLLQHVPRHAQPPSTPSSACPSWPRPTWTTGTRPWTTSRRSTFPASSCSTSSTTSWKSPAWSSPPSP